MTGVATLVFTTGCLEESPRRDSETGDTTVKSHITVLNRSDTDHDVEIVVHNETIGERVVDETAAILAGERHSIDITTQGDERGLARAWAEIRLLDPGELWADNHSARKETTLGSSDAAAFSGDIRDDHPTKGGDVTLGLSVI